MKLELSHPQLVDLVSRQLGSLFILYPDEQETLAAAIDHALGRCEACFAVTPDKYYRKDGEVRFNPFHSGQYCIFLYFLSNSISRHHPDKQGLADRVYYLNKALNACDLFHQIELPGIFRLDHPVGSVMGRARYGNYFTFSQHCTVGNNKGVYPRFGDYVTMHSGAKILGDCEIGTNVVLSANSYVKDTNIPDNSLVFGMSPNLVIKPNRRTPGW